MKVFALIFFLLTTNSFANRQTSFDDRSTCQESKGVWRQFNNGCVDKCISKLDVFSICTRAITYGCDCGKGRCWEDGNCMQMSDYEKFYNSQKEVETEELEEAKKRRHSDFIEHKEKILTKLYENKNAASQGQTYDSSGASIAPATNFSDIYKKNSPPPQQQIIVEQPQNPQIQSQPIIIQPVPGQIIAAPTQTIIEPQPTPYFLIQQEELQKTQEEKKKAEEAKKSKKLQAEDPSIPSLPIIPLPN